METAREELRNLIKTNSLYNCNRHKYFPRSYTIAIAKRVESKITEVDSDFNRG